MCEHCEAVAAALHADHEDAAEIQEVTAAEVEVARIQAERDVTLARISAGTEKATVEAQTDADLVAAVTEAQVLETVVETLTPEPEPAAQAPPVVITNDVPEEPAPTDLPPAGHEHHDDDGEPKAAPKRGFF